jgi:fido (protein-threonine AMPylation protein)
MRDLHVRYAPERHLLERLEAWDEAVRRDAVRRPGNWRLVALWSAARSATVSGSTGIEGNPLGPEEVDEVLSGGTVDASPEAIREVENYNRALELSRDLATRPGFRWSHEVIQVINRTVMDGLPHETRGRYRSEDVTVGLYRPPSHLLIEKLMGSFVQWLQAARDTPLVRAALAQLNLIAIHPFEDGNGRTARLLSAIEMIRDGAVAPELISVEAYLRRNRDGYILALQEAIGYTYDPENHPATSWLDYYTRISLDRLESRNRIDDALPADLGEITAVLRDAEDPADWAPTLLAARVAPLRTNVVARLAGRSAPVVRAELGRMVRRDWLRAEGRTRGRRYLPSDRLEAVRLRVPDMVRAMHAGEQP